MLRLIALDRPLTVFDLESTGTDAQRDRIVAISVRRSAGHSRIEVRLEA